MWRMQKRRYQWNTQRDVEFLRQAAGAWIFEENALADEIEIGGKGGNEYSARKIFWRWCAKRYRESQKWNIQLYYQLRYQAPWVRMLEGGSARRDEGKNGEDKGSAVVCQA